LWIINIRLQSRVSKLSLKKVFFLLGGNRGYVQYW
jgi:hypothetical protein